MNTISVLFAKILHSGCTWHSLFFCLLRTVTYLGHFFLYFNFNLLFRIKYILTYIFFLLYKNKTIYFYYYFWNKTLLKYWIILLSRCFKATKAFANPRAPLSEGWGSFIKISIDSHPKETPQNQFCVCCCFVQNKNIENLKKVCFPFLSFTK